MAKIAIIFDCFYPAKRGGAEKVYRAIADAFVDAGHNVTFVTRQIWDDTNQPETAFNIHTVWSGEIYNARGERTVQGALRFSSSVANFLLRNRHSFDAVIVSSTPAFLIPLCRVILGGTKTKLISDWLEVWSANKWRSYAGAIVGTVGFVLQYVALKASRFVLVNSQFTLEKARKYIPRTPVVTLGLFDLTTENNLHASPEVNKSDSSKEQFGLFVGRLIPDKRLGSLAEPLALLATDLPSFTLKVVGTGPDRIHAEKIFEECGVRGKVEFLEKVSDTELDTLYRGAAVHLFPSVREGFGLVVAEAATHGTPTILVDGPDNAAVELIHTGVNGYVSQTHNPKEISTLITQVVAQGESLRKTTQSWFEVNRQHRNLAASVQEISDRLGLQGKNS